MAPASRGADTLESVVQVEGGFARSVHIERDMGSETAGAYVVTPQCVQILDRIARGLESDRTSRAWTLTGPYGSGKSAFGTFLTQLLDKGQPLHGSSIEKVRALSPSIAERLERALLSEGRGLLPVAITGHRTSPTQCLLDGLARALSSLPNTSRKRAAQKGAVPAPAASSRDVLRFMDAVCDSAREAGYAGLAIVFDEMGKALEQSAREPQEADIHVLQEVAEIAQRSGERPVLFIGILHQAFEQYAHWLESTTRSEWAKVQGRFEDVAFQEPPEQIMALVASAVSCEAADLSLVSAQVCADAEACFRSGLAPQAMSLSRFTDLCESAYPIHPSLLVALPIVFRRFAQNERSLFSYLAAEEPLGFKDQLRRRPSNSPVPVYVTLVDLFDYLQANLYRSVHTHPSARRLAEVVDAMDRTQDLSPFEAAVLKAIGILNVLSDASSLKANVSVVTCSVGFDTAETESLLASLQRRSLVTYRKYRDSYIVWEGSDVDVGELVRQARRKSEASFSPASEASRLLPRRPLVARRHSYQTGTLKYFDPVYLSANNLTSDELAVPAGATGVVAFCMPRVASEDRLFEDWARSEPVASRPDLIVVVPRHASVSRLNDVLLELSCINEVSSSPVVRDDRVARREISERAAELERLAAQEVEHLYGATSLPKRHNNRWYHRGVALSLGDGGTAAQALSAVCDSVYDRSPRIWNELVNRNSLSSAAAKARRNLVEAMLLRGSVSRLGIEGFPPEASMYETLLRGSGIHQIADALTWKFGSPEEKDPFGLLPAWRALEEAIFATGVSPMRVADLERRLSSPPFGITSGVFPVLLCAFMLAHREETSLYREGTFVPEPTVADWEVLIRRLDLFSVGGAKVTGARQRYLSLLASAIGETPKIVPVARRLVLDARSLSDHASRTTAISDGAKNLRRALQTAKSPESLLFFDIPQALGYDPGTVSEDDGVAQSASEGLSRALDELKSATSRMIERAYGLLLETFGYPPSRQGWDVFLADCLRLKEEPIDTRLTPLVTRAAMEGGFEATVDGVLAIVGNRPPKTWSDSDERTFKDRVERLGPIFESQATQSIERALTESEREMAQRVTAPIRSAVLAAAGGATSRRVLAASLLRLAREFSQEGGDPLPQPVRKSRKARGL